MSHDCRCVTLLTGFGGEAVFVDALLAEFDGRLEDDAPALGHLATTLPRLSARIWLARDPLAAAMWPHVFYAEVASEH